VSPAQLTEIERRRVMAGRFGLDLSALVLDMTNFGTFTGTGNEKAPIARRGKAKQKRHDLWLVGPALLVTTAADIPGGLPRPPGQPVRRHPVLRWHR
jgi:hypothetical protein